MYCPLIFSIKSGPNQRQCIEAGSSNWLPVYSLPALKHSNQNGKWHSLKALCANLLIGTQICDIISWLVVVPFSYQWSKRPPSKVCIRIPTVIGLTIKPIGRNQLAVSVHCLWRQQHRGTYGAQRRQMGDAINCAKAHLVMLDALLVQVNENKSTANSHYLNRSNWNSACECKLA